MLSIVTISFRDPQGLAATIQSLHPLLGQESILWEHVVIDSSPFENRPILENLPVSWPIVHQEMPAHGIYAALNQGIRSVKGEIVWFLNGGDTMSASGLVTLRKCIEIFETRPDVSVVCAGAQILRDGKLFSRAIPHPDFKRNILGINHLVQQQFFYRKSTFEKVGLFDESYSIAADYLHAWKVILVGLKVLTIPEVVVDFTMGGVSNARFRDSFSETRKVQLELASSLGVWLSLQNSIAFYRHRSQIELIKAFGRVSWLKKMLRPLWHAWLRR